jgi:hypothetical protein
LQSDVKETSSGKTSCLTEVWNAKRIEVSDAEMSKFAFRLSFELSANYISWISVSGLKFGEKFYVQEKEPRCWKSTPPAVSDLLLLVYGFWNFSFRYECGGLRGHAKQQQKTLKLHQVLLGAGDGSVGIETSYELYDPWFGVQVPVGPRIFTSTSSGPALECTQSPIQRVRGPFPRR